MKQFDINYIREIPDVPEQYKKPLSQRTFDLNDIYIGICSIMTHNLRVITYESLNPIKMNSHIFTYLFRGRRKAA